MRAKQFMFDVLALGALLIGTLWFHRILYVHAGLCFGAQTRVFAEGHRLYLGEGLAPSGGTHVLPVYVDAALQRIAGGTFGASVWAASIIRLVRGLVVWWLARPSVGSVGGVAIAVFCGIAPVLGDSYHSGSVYMDVFVLVTAALLLKVPGPWGGSAAGAIVGLASLVESATVVPVSLALAIGLAVFWRRGTLPARTGFAILVGFLAAVVVSIIVVASSGELASWADALRLVPRVPRGVSLYSLVAPAGVVTLAVWLVARPREIALSEIGVLLVPIAILVALIERDQTMSWQGAIPALLAVVLVVLSLGAPARAKEWFGLEPFDTFVLVGLPIVTASSAALVVGVVLCLLRSVVLSEATKRSFCIVLAIAAVAHHAALRRSTSVAFDEQAVDGTRGRNRVATTLPLFHGVKVHAWRAAAVDWLGEQVPRGSTCAVDDDLQLAATITGCKRVSSQTLPDFVVTARDPDLARYQIVGALADNAAVKGVEFPAVSCDPLRWLRLYRRRRP